MDTISQEIEDCGLRAQNSRFALLNCSSDTIQIVLSRLSELLQLKTHQVLLANAKDIENARLKNLSPALIDRLMLNKNRIQSMARAVDVVRDLPDPVGRILWETQRPNGLHIQRIAVPIGVLGMVYEARPNVTIDAAALCLKSRNAVILRGGSESFFSSLALHELIEESLIAHNLPSACVSMIKTPDRAAVGALLAADHLIDVMIPRGGKSLIERVMAEARMPVFSHLEGLCHVYIHHSADPAIALSVPLNAKMRRTGICGAMETLLLDRNLDKTLAKEILKKLLDQGCEIVGDQHVQNLDNRIGIASEQDWRTEYLAPKLSCAFVQDDDAAIHHINHYGSHHTDSILAQDESVVEKFLRHVDSGIVMHNTSTQFADGGEFGMGAEIGIATGKLHARGPVGVEQLCTYKYIVKGRGQLRP